MLWPDMSMDKSVEDTSVQSRTYHICKFMRRYLHCRFCRRKSLKVSDITCQLACSITLIAHTINCSCKAATTGSDWDELLDTGANTYRLWSDSTIRRLNIRWWLRHEDASAKQWHQTMVPPNNHSKQIYYVEYSMYDMSNGRYWTCYRARKKSAPFQRYLKFSRGFVLARLLNWTFLHVLSTIFLIPYR